MNMNTSKWKKVSLLLYWLAAPLIVTAGAQIISGLPFTLTNGTVADATQVMADFNQIVNNTNANAAKNGVNADITALSALVTPLTPAQGGSTLFIGGTSTGAANTQVVATAVPTGLALANKPTLYFNPGFTNTGAMTLNANGTGATNLFKPSFSGPVALTGGEVILNQLAQVTYDGTRWVLVIDTPAFGVETAIASAATTDLGTIASHNIQVTGTTGITSFGSSASADFPIYMLRFGGILTITPGGNLVLPGSAVITTAGNDTATVKYFGAGLWLMTSYTRAGGFPLSGTTLQVFTSNGTYTPRSGLNYATIECYAGGGSGAGGTGTVGTTNVGGGGGAGGYAKVIATAATIGVSQAVTVGVGGTAPAAGNTVGGAGGLSSVGALCSASAGQGGLAGSGNAPGAGGAGGAGTVGTILGTGQRGTTGVAAAIATIAAVGGVGAPAVLGSGGSPGIVGAGGTGTSTGQPGLGYVAGGGGGVALNTNTTFTGGNGQPGIVIVTEQ